MTGMTKQYPGCLANDHVSLTVERNQIHALLGENGAGKSTLVKIIYGVVKPDEGEIIWEGQKVTIQNPGHAQRLGIGMVFQHFSLFEALTVTENIALGLGSSEERVGLRERIIKISNRVRPAARSRPRGARSVGRRTPAHRNRPLPVAKSQTSDHGRADLGADAVRGAEAVRDVAPAGRGGLLDPLYQPQAGGSAGAVLRRHHHAAGPQRGAGHPGGEDRQGTGGDHDQHGSARADAAAADLASDAKPRLVLDHLTIRSPNHFGTDLKDISLSIAGGEILGIAGIAGTARAN